LTLKLDPTAGTLQNVSMVTAGTNASYLAWSPDKKYLYALNENGANGRLYAFGIDGATGALTAINNVAMPAGTNGAPHISVHPGGKWVFLAFYGSGHVTVHPVMPNGAVGEATDVQAPAATGCVNAHQAYNDPKGEFLFVPCKGSHVVLQFKFDEKTGKLAPNDPFKVTMAAGAGPRHMDIHPNRKWAYVINELDDTMVAFDYDLAKGLLTNPAAVPTLPAGVSGTNNTTAHVVVHPNGKFVYGSNRGHDSVVIYAVDQATGRLTLVGHELGDMQGRGKINVPRDFTIDPTGTFLLVANQRSTATPTVGNSVIVFRIDPATGKLTKTGVFEAAIDPTFVGVLPR
jgi:6-phosphogluconolactonase